MTISKRNIILTCVIQFWILTFSSEQKYFVTFTNSINFVVIKYELDADGSDGVKMYSNNNSCITVINYPMYLQCIQVIYVCIYACM